MAPSPSAASPALGKGNLTLNDGILQTGNNIHQVNVTGNLFWDSDVVIHLTLTPDPLTTESVQNRRQASSPSTAEIFSPSTSPPPACPAAQITSSS